MNAATQAQDLKLVKDATLEKDTSLLPQMGLDFADELVERELPFFIHASKRGKMYRTKRKHHFCDFDITLTARDIDVHLKAIQVNGNSIEFYTEFPYSIKLLDEGTLAISFSKVETISIGLSNHIKTNLEKITAKSFEIFLRPCGDQNYKVTEK